MIKNYEDFVNEGIVNNVMSGIDAGISAFRANKKAEKVADIEVENVLRGKEHVGREAQLTVLIRQLLERSAWLSDLFSYEDLMKKPDYLDSRVDRLEQIISRIKELLKEEDF